MRTKDDVLDELAYHPATPDVAATYATLREIAMGVVKETWDLIPDGPTKTIAYRGLQQWLMFANLSVAKTTPADLTNAAVARVLPESAVTPPAPQSDPPQPVDASAPSSPEPSPASSAQPAPPAA